MTRRSAGNRDAPVPPLRFPEVPSEPSEHSLVPEGSQRFPVEGFPIPQPKGGNREPRSTSHARAARRERQAAELLGTKRVLRSRYESAPDVEPVTLPCGVRLIVEVKTRAKLPKLVTSALTQAEGYGQPGDVPLFVMSETGAEPLAVLPLRAFRRIAGLDAANDTQASLALDVELGADERRVMAYLRARLLEGQCRYGVLDLAADPRDWRNEQAEELADLLVYAAFETLKGGDHG